MLEQIRSDLVASMKAKSVVRTETLRFLLAGIRNMAIATYGSAGESSVTDVNVMDVLKKQVKTHKESIVAFQKGNRQDLIEKEQGQLVILESYLPKALSDEEIVDIIRPVLASGEKNFGLLMKQAMEKVAGRAEGGRVASLLKSHLQA